MEPPTVDNTRTIRCRLDLIRELAAGASKFDALRDAEWRGLLLDQNQRNVLHGGIQKPRSATSFQETCIIRYLAYHAVGVRIGESHVDVPV